MADGSKQQAANQIRAWSIGLDMAYTMGGGLLLGALIDAIAGTRPGWMLGLGLFGLVAGLMRFIRDAMRVNREAAGRGARNPAEGENPGPDRSPPR